MRIGLRLSSSRTVPASAIQVQVGYASRGIFPQAQVSGAQRPGSLSWSPRVTQRLANYSVFAVGSADQQAAVKSVIGLDLATLGDVGINAVELAKSMALAAIQDAIAIALKPCWGWSYRKTCSFYSNKNGESWTSCPLCFMYELKWTSCPLFGGLGKMTEEAPLGASRT